MLIPLISLIKEKIDINSNGTPTTLIQNCPCDIIWQSCTYHENNASEIHANNYSINNQHSIKINKFPSMNCLLRKGPLTRALNVMRKIFKEEYVSILSLL